MTNPLLVVILMDNYFIDLMLEQFCRRNKSGLIQSKKITKKEKRQAFCSVSDSSFHSIFMLALLFVWISNLVTGQNGNSAMARLWHSQFLLRDCQPTSASKHLQNWRREILIFLKAWWRTCPASDPVVVITNNTLSSCFPHMHLYR